MYYDTHVHSTFSPDGKSGIQEYAALIDAGKLKGIGFTEHLDFMPECGAFYYLDYSLYTASINKYRAKGYEFYIGAEVDYGKKVEEDIKARLQEEAYDYTICSVHMANGISVSDVSSPEYFESCDSFRDVLELYYRELEYSLRFNKADVIGHIGIYKRHLRPEFYERFSIKDYIRDMDDQLARSCALSDKIIEVNTSGLFSASGTQIPDEQFLKQYFLYGGRNISIGSDAHSATHAGRGIGEVSEMLGSMGFEYCFLPWDRQNPVRLGK